MTNVEKQSSNTHENSGARGFEALNTKSTWSSFDDITWDDFNGDDHSVPEPDELPSQPLWLRGRRRAAELKNFIKEEAESPMEVDNWDVAELGTVPDNLLPDNELMVDELKPDSSSPSLLPAGLCLDEQVFNEEDDASAAHFTYVPAEEEIALFGSENDVDKGGTSLLSYAWENLEDMDNLFQNEESPFIQDATDALIHWPPSSSSSPDSSSPVNASSTANAASGLRAMKGKSLEEDVKMEFIPCERLRSSSEIKPEACLSNSELDGVMEDHPEAETKCSGDDRFQESLQPLTSSSKDQKPLELADKAQIVKQRQASHRRDRMKKQLYPKKPGQALIQPKRTPYSSPQLKPALASSLQVYPQVMGPGVAPGMLQRAPQYVGPVHHGPYLLQGSPVVCYEEAPKLEAMVPPPVSGSNMTPQEKIEKLRWKQKMQQQLAKQCLSLDHQSPKQKQGKSQGKRPLVENETGSLPRGDEGEGRFVEANVLGQLLTIMSKLDVGTRICIRDALYRLAKSAVNRQSGDGASSSECSNTSAAPRRCPVMETETETNPIDRSIVNLLFHRRNAGEMLGVSEWNEDGGGGGGAGDGDGDGDGDGGGDRNQGGEMSSESEGSSRKVEKRSSLKREASSEFLSSEEDRKGRGASISSGRDGKAAKTGIQ